MPPVLGPWCQELVTSPLSVGSPGVQRLLRCRPFLGLGVKSWLRHRSLLRALVFRDFYVAARSWALVLRASYVTARCWEPWCYLASLGSLRGLIGALSEPFWGPLGVLLGRLGDLLGRLVGTGPPLGVLGLSWGPLGPSWEPVWAFLGLSWGPLGAL